MSADGVAVPYGGVIAKPITRGPSAPSTTYWGPNSPCTSPAWWTAASPVAMPIASASSSAPPRGPEAATTSDSSGPATYSLTR